MKRYSMKAAATALLSLAVTGMVFSANVNAAEAVTEANFQDPVFRDYIFTNFDKDGNKTLSEEEMDEIKEIDVSGLNITSLSGIKHFGMLNKLNCSNTKVKSLDLNDNEALLTIDCSNCKITSLNISDCYFLEELNCSNNSLKSFSFSNEALVKLDISNNASLKTLNVAKNAIKELNLDGCTALTDLDVSNNQLAELDVSKNTALTDLSCTKNALKKLDLSSNTALAAVDCSDNKIDSLTLGTNDKLTKIIANDNMLASIDVSKCVNLLELKLNRNELKSLDIKSNKDMKILDVDDNNIPSIDITNNQILLQTFINGETKDIEGTVTYVLNKDGVEGELSLDPEVKIITKGAMVLNKMSTSLVCGESETLKATQKGFTAKITWKSSKSDVATVDSKGKVTAKMAGTTKITATANGKTVECLVTVLYKDVKNTKDFWFAPTNYLTAAGVVKGYDNQTNFKPSNECTRAQMVTFLWRLAGSPKPKAKTTDFTDVKSSDYFFKPVIWAVEQGITTGASKDKFNPKGVCTRAQTVTFLWRMAGKPEPKTKTCKFGDVKSSDYFYKATIWASEKKIVAGYDDGSFKPQGNCLRRQMVTFLYKYDKFVNGKG
jgi:hypothetical protein